MSNEPTARQQNGRSHTAVAMMSAFLGHLVAWVFLLLVGYVVESGFVAFGGSNALFSTSAEIGAYSFSYWPLSIPVAVVLGIMFLRFRGAWLDAARLQSARLLVLGGGVLVSLAVALFIFVPLSTSILNVGALLDLEPGNLSVAIAIVTALNGAACCWFLVTLFKDRGGVKNGGELSAD